MSPYCFKSTASFSPAMGKTENAIVSSVARLKGVEPKPTNPKKDKKESAIKKKSAIKATVASPPQAASQCWVDASQKHIAILIGKEYKIFTLKAGWDSEGRDINWAETAAFELLAHALVADGRTGVIKVNSDSVTALRAVCGNELKSKEIMESAQRLVTLVKVSNLRLECVQVSGKANLADPFTKGRTVDGYKQIKARVAIPEALAPFLTAD